MWPFHKEYEGPEATTVTCTTCGHIIAKNRAVKVTTYNEYGVMDDWYCKEHQQPYDKRYENTFCLGTIYLKEMSVDVNGCPIGYVKITEVANDVT